MIATYCKAKSINLTNIIQPKYQEIVQKKYGFKDWESVLAAIGHGGLKEGQVVNRLAEEYGKDHRQAITDEVVLERVAEAAKNKVHIAKSKSGIVVKGIDDMAVRFPDAVIRYREMRLSDSLLVEEVCPFTVQTVSI